MWGCSRWAVDTKLDIGESVEEGVIVGSKVLKDGVEEARGNSDTDANISSDVANEPWVSGGEPAADSADGGWGWVSCEEGTEQAMPETRIPLNMHINKRLAMAGTEVILGNQR